jgi:hypothetical protein
MLHRRPTAIAAPVLGLLLAASLSACGFHYPTDRVNTISAGVNNRTTSVDALGIRILASAPGEGRLIGALANESETDVALTKVGTANGDVTAAPFKPVKLLGRAGYNLSTAVADPIELSGDFEPGQVVMGLQMTFTRNGNDETIELNVPVVKPCHQYTAVPTPSSASSSASSAPTGGASASSPASSSTAASSSSASSTASETATSSMSASTDTNAFSCTDPSPTEAPAE